MNRYEYQNVVAKVAELVDGALTERLNRLGAEGWRLVATVPSERHGYSQDVHLFFMRTAENA